MQGEKPNILLVHGHDMGRSFSPYGSSITTPHVNALADEGVVLENYFCPAPQCSPSRASMMTGRYPHASGMLGLAHLGWQLHEPAHTLPNRLKQHGYETFLFGLQHEADDPATLGYSHSVATDPPCTVKQVLPPFLDFLSSREDKHDAPFFASVGLFEAHRPFDYATYPAVSPEAVEVPSYLPDTPEVRQDLAAFYGMILAADDALGTVLSKLKATGLDKTTLLVFTTDHGVAFPRAKGTLYDPGLEAACLLRWPGHIDPGRFSALLCNVDLTPTLLEAAGIIMPEASLDGRSFLPLLTGQPYAPRDHFMCEMTYHERYAPVRGIRTESWKYIRHFYEDPRIYLPDDVAESPSAAAFLSHHRQELPPEELYDLRTDPSERYNLAGRDSGDGTLERLRAAVEQWMGLTNDPLLRGVVPLSAQKEP